MPAEIHKAWSRTVAMLALLLALATLAGALAGYPWEALALAALAVIAWHYWRLQRVLERLTARRRQPPAQHRADAVGAAGDQRYGRVGRGNGHGEKSLVRRN